MEYNKLDKHFTKPNRISPFYIIVRIPRKIKKKIKCAVGVYWDLLDNGQRVWYFLGKTNTNYQRFLIKKICELNTYIQIESFN